MNQQYRPSSFSYLPPVVKNILIINVLFYLAMWAMKSRFNIDLIELLGLHYWGSEAFKPYQFITYMFMHSFDFNHILFNMFAVWMFGVALENLWGPKKFLIFYLITGIGAAITHYVVFWFELRPVLEALNHIPQDMNVESIMAYFNSKDFVIFDQETLNAFKSFSPRFDNAVIANNNNLAVKEASSFLIEYKHSLNELLNKSVVVGASGAVFGILLAFGMMFPNSLIYLYFFIPLKAKYFVIIYGLAELFFGVSNAMGFTSLQSNVAHFAHLGGMLFGFILIMLWKKSNTFRRN